MSAELNIIDASQKLFSINKTDIIFEISSNKITNSSNLSQNRIKIGETSIIVTNISSKYLNFRVMTTKKKNYSVEPSYTILSPNENKILKVIYYVNPGEKVSNSGHKYKFEGYIIPPEEKDQESRMLFLKHISQKIPVKAYVSKASVKFINNNDASSELDSNINNSRFSKNKIDESINNSKTKTNNFESINNNISNNIDNNTNKNININNNNTNDFLKEEININNEIIEKKKEKEKEKLNQDNIILKENNSHINNKNNNIVINEKEELNDKIKNELYSNKDDKISDLNLMNIQSSKTITINTNKSLLNKIEPQNTNMILTQEKNRYEKNSLNDYTPKKKRYSSINQKMEEFENPKTEEEDNALLNNLKVEYYKLKNELDNLIERYYNLKNHVDLEEDNKEINDEENLKNAKYSQNKKKEIKLPQHICFALCIFAVLLGFYLS